MTDLHAHYLHKSKQLKACTNALEDIASGCGVCDPSYIALPPVLAVTFDRVSDLAKDLQVDRASSDLTSKTDRIELFKQLLKRVKHLGLMKSIDGTTSLCALPTLIFDTDPRVLCICPMSRYWSESSRQNGLDYFTQF